MIPTPVDWAAFCAGSLLGFTLFQAINANWKLYQLQKRVYRLEHPEENK